MPSPGKPHILVKRTNPSPFTQLFLLPYTNNHKKNHTTMIPSSSGTWPYWILDKATKYKQNRQFCSRLFVMKKRIQTNWR